MVVLELYCVVLCVAYCLSCKNMLSTFLVKGERFVFHHHGTYARWKTFSPFTKKVPTFSATQTFAAQRTAQCNSNIANQ
eukprot:UN22326